MQLGTLQINGIGDQILYAIEQILYAIEQILYAIGQILVVINGKIFF